jgi:hypothetical protein
MSENTTTENTTTDLTTDTALALYRAAADTKARNEIRRAVEAQRDAAIDALDLDLAKAWKAALEGLSVAKAAPAKVEIDWAQITANVLADAEELVRALGTGEARVEGCPTDYTFDLDERGMPVLPEPTTDRGTAVYAALHAATKAVKSGPQVRVQSVIDTAFEGTDKGTFLTVSEICNKAGYPHTGAVSARLLADTCTLKGVVPTPAKGDQPLGATKA